MSYKDKCIDYFEIWNIQDVELLRKCFTEDVILRDWEILANGVDEVCQANQDIWDNTDSINIVLLNQVQENNQVVNEIAIEVNKEETLLVVDIIEFDDNGLIKKIEAYKG